MISNSNKENIILGDVNINYKLRHSHPFELLKKIERDFGLKQLTHMDTGITARSSTLIDIILTDCEYITASGVLELCISDHYAVYMVKKKPRLKHQKVKSTGRSYKFYNKIEMQKSFRAHTKWREFWQHECNIDMM